MREKKIGARKGGKDPIDFRLVTARLEKGIMEGKDPARCLEILSREDVWKKLDVQMQLKWARLAQMGGDVELALKIFTHLNQTSPRKTDAWIEHLELLSILGRKERLAQVLAASRNHIGEEQHRIWRGSYQSETEERDRDIGAALEPFEKLRQREEAVQRYLDLFSGREDCFARQWANRPEGKQGYVPVRRPMAEQDVEEHLSGKKTYGIYLLRADSTVRVAVIDVDVDAKFRKGNLNRDDKDLIRRERAYIFTRIIEMAKESGLMPVSEFSGGKGFHFWFFFEKPVSAGSARRPLERIRQTLEKDLSAFQIEVFPKQDNLSGKGFGNLVKLPLGVHRLTGKRSYFIDCHDRGVEAQLAFLQKIRATDPEKILVPADGIKRGEVLIHPRMKGWADKYPELASLESLCPPLGQVIASCRNGKPLSLREEKILFQTVGFLPRAGSLVHHLLSSVPDYNPHMVDYKLSRLRGSPLGCRRIHSLLSFTGDICPFNRPAAYPHPLLHVDQWKEDAHERSEKVNDLSSALENLKRAIAQTEAFLQ
ncbi:MAG: DNA primase [Deltaproteobacteria bacterium]|nr:DNA primase [Deltaproteobacteria bacterium]